MRLIGIFLIYLSAGILGPSAQATLVTLSPNYAAEAASETVPLAFKPFQLSVDEFEFEWVGTPLSGVQLELGKESLDWVRVSEFLVLPRARLFVKADQVSGGQVRYHSNVQAFGIEDSQGSAEIPIALTSGEKNPIQIITVKDGKQKSGTVLLRFRPKQALSFEQRIGIDVTCSPYQVAIEKNMGARPDEWMFVGCRLVYSKGSNHRTSTLEIYAYWDGVGQTIKMGEVATPSISSSLWLASQGAKPGVVKFVAGSHELALRYKVPEYLHKGTLALGLGPYAYQYRDAVSNVNTTIPLVTLYLNFFLDETTKFVVFEAIAAHEKFNSDLGLYLMSESFKTLDERFSISLMFGAHMLTFPSLGKTQNLIGAPQGIEATYRDLFVKGYNTTVGAFVYPKIDGKSYYNVWLRWGRPGFFVEFNYISWSELLHDSLGAAQEAYSQSLGISVGFPIFRFM
jgi:hypothetical protein